MKPLGAMIHLCQPRSRKLMNSWWRWQRLLQEAFEVEMAALLLREGEWHCSGWRVTTSSEVWRECLSLAQVPSSWKLFPEALSPLTTISRNRPKFLWGSLFLLATSSRLKWRTPWGHGTDCSVNILPIFRVAWSVTWGSVWTRDRDNSSSGPRL